jgi:hypothetical protein
MPPYLEGLNNKVLAAEYKLQLPDEQQLAAELKRTTKRRPKTHADFGRQQENKVMTPGQKAAHTRKWRKAMKNYQWTVNND